jgi:hypothetical protein
VKENLSLTNSVVIAAVTVWKDGKSVSLQSRSYGFSLDEYFQRISGKCRDNGRREISYVEGMRRDRENSLKEPLENQAALVYNLLRSDRN